MKAMRTAAAATLAVGLCLPSMSPARAVEPAPLDVVERGISSMVARHMVDTCLDLATSRGWKMQVAVADRSGALVAFGRNDGAISGAQDISFAKARTAARFAWSTEQFAQYAWPANGREPEPLAFTPGTSGIPGGLPIFTPTGDHLGGIGVSGSLPTNDVECAKAAIEKAAARYVFP